ncbi:beta-lactamase-like protein [Helicostylum pulchrum]|nr:beta-lactamase-like protein [Helicostylum pulchrum]
MVSLSVLPPPAPTDKSFKITNRANELFVRHLYNDAISEYTKVLQLSKEDDEFIALIYCNRSASYLRLNQYEQAQKDASRAMELAPVWSKGYFRYAQVLMKLWKFDQAIELIKTAIHKEDETHVTEMTGFLQRALIEKDNEMMGVRIIQLVCGKDIAIQKSVLNPIQNKLFEFASHMKNIIHVIVDIESKQCILVDACWDIENILRLVEEQGYTVVATIITHYHFDHVGGSPPSPYDTLPIKISGLASLLKKIPHIKAYIHPLDIPYIQQANPNIQVNRLVPTCTPDITQHLNIGKIQIEFIHTPGHTPGSQSLMVNQCRLIAGDTLLCGGHCGRTDLPGGHRKSMEHTLRHILGGLDDRIIVYPGHDYGISWSTIGMERENGCLGEELVGFGMKSQ